MTDHDSAPEGLQKKIAIVLALLCLAVGFFLGGTIVAMYMTPSPAQQAMRQPAQQQMPPQTQAPQMDPRVQRLEQIAQGNPQSFKAWVDLGNAYFGSNRHKDAIQAYSTALALDPDNADVWTDKGVMHRRDGDPQKALESFAKAIEVDPRHEIARFNSGIVYLHDLNQPDRAKAMWAELLVINPNATAPNGQPIQQLIDGI